MLYTWYKCYMPIIPQLKKQNKTKPKQKGIQQKKECWGLPWWHNG